MVWLLGLDTTLIKTIWRESEKYWVRLTNSHIISETIIMNEQRDK